MFAKRHSFRGDENLSYSIPKMDIICSIVDFLIENNCLQVIEIGAGTGLWASLIQIVLERRSNINFIATDKFAVGKGLYGYKYTYTKVENMDALNAIKKYKNSNCLFLCWPPWQDMVEEGQYSAGKVLKIFEGDYLISIGENARGYSTGDDLFYDELEKNWDHLEDNDIDMFIKGGIFTIYDSVYFYKRKPKVKPKEDEMRDTFLRSKGRIIASMHNFQEEYTVRGSAHFIPVRRDFDKGLITGFRPRATGF